MHKHPSTRLAFTYGKIIIIHDIPLLHNTISIEYHNVSKHNSVEEGPCRKTFYCCQDDYEENKEKLVKFY